MNVLTRDQWGAQPPNRSYVNIGWGDRPGLETHHSVGIYRATTAAEFAWRVQDDHLGRGWTDVFYNYLIWTDGQIVEARPDHAKSGPIEHLTVCFAGNYNNRTLTDAQNRSWHEVRAYLLGNGGGQDVAWHGQRAAVDCPGSNNIVWLKAGHPLPGGAPEQPEEEDVNVLPLVKKQGDDKVWVAVGRARTHLQDWQWKLMEPRAASKIKTLPADHEFWSYPVIGESGGGHTHTVSGTAS